MKTKILRIFIVLIFISVSALIIFFAVGLYKEQNPAETKPKIVNSDENRKEVIADSIFYVSNDSVIDMQPYKNKIIILANSTVVYLDEDGESSVNKHNYANPAVEIYKSNVLLYDRGGTHYRVENENGILFEYESEYPIYCATLYKNNIALSTDSENANSYINVHNFRNETIFSANIVEQYVIKISFINSDTIAVSAVCTKDARIYSIIRVYEFDYASELFTETFFDETIIDIFAKNKNHINLISDTAFSQYDYKKDVVNTFDTHSGVLLRAIVATSDYSRIGLLTSHYTNTENETLDIFKRNGDLLTSVVFLTNIKSISNNDKYIIVNFGNYSKHYTFSGEYVGSVSFNWGQTKSIVSGSKVYLLSQNNIYVFNVRGEYIMVDYQPEPPTIIEGNEEGVTD
ncbi:MAG TPA: hypothetical protein GXZ23_02480 [Clostridiales bacterium]|nr:hypothetical protein [Clostridiales bacterium]